MSIGIALRRITDGSDSPASKEVPASQGQNTNPIRRILRSEAPEMYALLDQQMAILNKQNGTNFTAPVLILNADDYAPAYISDSNAITLDPASIERFKRDPSAFAALMGHELAHLFQHNDPVTEMAREIEANSLSFRRKMEADADRVGALLTSPAALVRGLNRAYETASHLPSAMAIILFMKENHTDFGTAQATVINTLTGKDYDALIARVDNLSASEKSAFSRKYLQELKAWEQVHEEESEHPALTWRINELEKMEREQKREKRQSHDHVGPHPESKDDKLSSLDSFSALLARNEFNHSHEKLGTIDASTSSAQHLGFGAVRNQLREI